MSSYLEKDNSTLKHNIQQYVLNKITINKITYQESVILSETQDIATWDVKSYKDITIDTIQKIFIPENGILLIGTGEKHQIIDLNLIAKTIQVLVLF